VEQQIEFELVPKLVNRYLYGTSVKDF